MAEQLMYYGTGHRKDAIARVWLTPGEDQITINGKLLKDYVTREVLERMVKEPLVLVRESAGSFSVRATARGGGVSGQAGAVRHGIALALLRYDEGLRKVLRAHGFLTRDPRVKERKKYGRKRARRGFQFSKR